MCRVDDLAVWHLDWQCDDDQLFFHIGEYSVILFYVVPESTNVAVLEGISIRVNSFKKRYWVTI